MCVKVLAKSINGGSLAGKLQIYHVSKYPMIKRDQRIALHINTTATTRKVFP
jgi:hypothetical protein